MCVVVVVSSVITSCRANSTTLLAEKNWKVLKSENYPSPYERYLNICIYQNVTL